MDDKVFNTEEKAKLTQLINEGMQVMHEVEALNGGLNDTIKACLLYTSPSPRDGLLSRMPSSA